MGRLNFVEQAFRNARARMHELAYPRSKLAHGVLGRPFSPSETVLAAFGAILVVLLVPVLGSRVDEELARIYGALLDDLLVAGLVPLLTISVLRRAYGNSPSLTQLFIAFVAIGIPVNVAWSALVMDALVFGPSHPPLFSASPLLEPGSTATCISLCVFLVLRERRRLIAEASIQISAERSRTEEEQVQRQLMEAKLMTLQAQIEPHFLYNTLANLQFLVSERSPDAERMLTSLIRYLRESLPLMREKVSTLGREFALSAAYLDIAKIRLGHRLSVTVDLPDELREAAFPPLLVQTLVENAVKHGIERKPGPVHIQVVARQGAGHLVVSVIDDGVGFQAADGTGVGLKNIRERLAVLFGGDASLALRAREPTGVAAEIRVFRER